MLALGIDTSSPTASVAVAGEDDRFAELTIRSGEPHARLLPGAVRAALALAGAQERSLDVISVANGPGGFTGLRIGMATAKGLALASGCPVVGFSTLETTALSAVRMLDGDDRAVAVMQEAGRGEIYMGVYRAHGTQLRALAPERSLTPEAALAAVPAGCLVCGSAVAGLVETFEGSMPRDTITLSQVPRIAVTLAQRAMLLLREERNALPPLIPNYLRASDAERNART